MPFDKGNTIKQGVWVVLEMEAGNHWNNVQPLKFTPLWMDEGADCTADDLMSDLCSATLPPPHSPSCTKEL